MRWRDLVSFEASLHDSSGRVRTTCPVCPHKAHSYDGKRSLSIDYETGWYRCFRCDFRGRLEGYELYVEEVAEAADDWQDLYRFDPPSSFALLADDPDPALAEARRYVASRGVSRQTCREAQIGFCKEGDHAGMVAIPLVDSDGCWMGWQGRSIKGRRFHTSKDKQALVFNEKAVGEATDVPLMVVEGIYDALPFWPNAVACLGQPDSSHAGLLSRATRPLQIVLDRDAWAVAQAFAERLQDLGRNASWTRLRDCKDPSTANHRLLWESVLNRCPTYTTHVQSESAGSRLEPLG